MEILTTILVIILKLILSWMVGESLNTGITFIVFDVHSLRNPLRTSAYTLHF